jgi:L-aspartate oxidase
MPKQVDFLVVGSGIAGLTFANKAAKHGDVLVLTKKRKADSSTNYAQGGIAAVFGENDAPEYHIRDTIKAGEGLCHKQAVATMVREGPALIRELHSMGCRFSMNSRGQFDLAREGGHSRRRIVHAKDFTGQEIERVLLEETKKSCVNISENEIALDLVVQDGECTGIYYLDADTRQIDLIYASTTVLATGGAGQVYNHTTNPPIATGDGIAMAYRAGAKIANMEFVQFHPTAVYNIKIDGRSFLISEAVRGEGGVLKTKDGTAFMKKYHSSGNLAPRDIVARACLTEMLKTKSKYVLLDVSQLQADFIKNRFPTIYETCLSWGLDITREPIPVVPAAHYLCGGILVNEWAETTIPRLFALGECSCTGVHGANRLASNSLLEALVFAKRAAERVASARALNVTKPVKIKRTAMIGPNLLFQIKEIMDQYVGLIRDEKGLRTARAMLDDFRRQFDDGIHIINAESRNVTVIAQLIIESALERKESRGLHFMTDYPRKKRMYCSDTVKELPTHDRS